MMTSRSLRCLLLNNAGSSQSKGMGKTRLEALRSGFAVSSEFSANRRHASSEDTICFVSALPVE